MNRGVGVCALSRSMGDCSGPTSPAARCFVVGGNVAARSGTHHELARGNKEQERAVETRDLFGEFRAPRDARRPRHEKERRVNGEWNFGLLQIVFFTL